MENPYYIMTPDEKNTLVENCNTCISNSEKFILDRSIDLSNSTLR